MTTDAGTQIELPRTLTVRELADLLNDTPVNVIKVLMTNGIMADVTKTIDFDTAAVVAVDMGFDPLESASDVVEEAEAPGSTDVFAQIDEEEDDPASLQPRAPVVAMLGHVDHGKTSLLDAIRNESVAEGEAGGITQAIGAYQAIVEGKPITFLDTPGHEAFTEMRARGAQATDIAVLVVAANDGVMPQTREAIDHIQAAGVPMVIALNKMDIENADPTRVKTQLTEMEVVIEEFGGETPLVEVSATTRDGIPGLLETLLLVAELQDKKANPDRAASGVVLEAELDPRQGARTTLLIQRGTLRIGDAVLAGETWGRVKAMFDSQGERLKEAGPAVPVSVLGMQGVARAGDRFLVAASDKEAKRSYEESKRSREAAEAKLQHAASLDALFGEITTGEISELNLVLKTDVDGSVEPLRQSLERLSNEEVHVKVIHAAPGGVSEADVNLALAATGIVLAFNTNTAPGANKLATAEGIEIRRFDIIYDLIETVEAAISGLLAPVEVEIVDAHAEVLQIFPIRGVGKIAGSRCDDGTVRRDSSAKVMRGGEEIARGTLSSLRRFQDDVQEVRAGQEFGVGVQGFEDFEPGDTLEFFHLEIHSRIVTDGRIETVET